MLVHNEDVFLRRAAENVLGFCDRLLIAEHLSTDGTPAIAADLAAGHPGKIEVHRIREPRESQHLLRPYVGTDTWVFGVDGDEIYDPAGLARTRAMLDSGAWQDWWVIFGNVLNCTEFDVGNNTARGYLSPPCRSMTKLYNFALLESLDPAAPQRLMGRHDRFRPGYSSARRLDLHETTSFDEAYFRCLHTCFLPRSSQAPAPARAAGTAVPPGRPNLTDLAKRPLLQRLITRVFGTTTRSPHKLAKYTRGPLVTKDITPFFPNPRGAEPHGA